MPKKNDTPEEEIFTDKKPKHPWDAKPLTLEGTARFIQLVGGLLGDAAQRAAVQELMTPDEQPQSRWTAMLGILGVEQLTELLCIVTGKSDRWVTRNYSLVNASYALGQFFANEDLGQVLKNLRPTAPNLLSLEAVEIDGSPEPSTDSSATTEEP